MDRRRRAAAFGLVFRFWTQSHLWLDEALSVNIARLPVGDIPEALRHDGHPPLYYWLLHAVDLGVRRRRRRGAGALGRVRRRGTAAHLVRRQARRRPNGRVARGRAAGPEPLGIPLRDRGPDVLAIVALALAAYLLVTKALEDDALWWLVGVALVTAALGAHPLLGAVPRRGRLRARRAAAEVAVDVSVCDSGARCLMAIGCLAFVPWLPSFAYQAAHTGSPWAKPIRPSTILTITTNDLGGVGSEGQVVGSVLTLLVLLALFAVAGTAGGTSISTCTPCRRCGSELAVRGLTVVFGVLAILVTSGTYESRHAVVFVPFLLLAAAVGVTVFLPPLVATRDRWACARPRWLARWLSERDQRTDAARSGGRSGAER